MEIAKAVEDELGNKQGKRTAEVAAEKSGFSNKETYRQAKNQCIHLRNPPYR
ncbi:hypothetical protein [Nitrosomonas sp. JL21]|uniref:hypothetical protein n=1 Tax=Nitrosomonas sp. JL21 TaxID=153949 RepID=UPI00136CFF4B|nr:hypothetical protein [Nitrosomonas sp. JL21]MBL8498536.1 hypothetical protein [Nitrosomonas sp.]